MRYGHTQTAPLYLVILGVSALLVILALRPGADPAVGVIALVAALLIGGLAFAFRSLTVEDGGEELVIRFGPLPIFRTSIPYAEITRVESGRSSLIDGWGIHYLPGRGWIWNLWGFGCVVIHLGARRIRIGTDDVTGLVTFLRKRTGDTRT